MSEKEGGKRTVQVAGDNIPEAHYNAMRKVWEEGFRIRTQYDRKKGDRYIDPPSRDSRVLVEVKNPFNQPRFSPFSHSEIGKYIAEVCWGVKDHLVKDVAQIKRELAEGDAADKESEGKHWPYHYHQRIFAYPLANGTTLDQSQVELERIAKDPHTRRAMLTTAVPWLDHYFAEDLPCLKEIQLRGEPLTDSDLTEGVMEVLTTFDSSISPEDYRVRVKQEKVMQLHMGTTWRSRDIKAWGDNVNALTFLQRMFAEELTYMTGNIWVPGSYTDESHSLHVYGQDFTHIGGDPTEGISGLFERSPNPQDFVDLAMTSEDVRTTRIIPEIEELIREKDQWHFPASIISLMRRELHRVRKRDYVV